MGSEGRPLAEGRALAIAPGECAVEACRVVVGEVESECPICWCDTAEVAEAGTVCSGALSTMMGSREVAGADILSAGSFELVGSTVW